MMCPFCKRDIMWHQTERLVILVPRTTYRFDHGRKRPWLAATAAAKSGPLRIEEVRFAVDSLLEGDGFELPVPRTTTRLLADLYAHNASRQMPQKGTSDQTVACLRRLGAGVVGSAAICAFRFRPPGTGSKRAGWRRSGAVFAFFGAVCFEPDASRARLRFKAVMRSMTGGGAAISLGLTVSPFSSWLRLVLARPPGNDLDTSSDRNFPSAAR